MGRLVGDWKRHTERGKRERDFKKLEKENYNVKNIDKKRATGNKHNKKSQNYCNQRAFLNLLNMVTNK